MINRPYLKLTPEQGKFIEENLPSGLSTCFPNIKYVDKEDLNKRQLSLYCSILYRSIKNEPATYENLGRYFSALCLAGDKQKLIQRCLIVEKDGYLLPVLDLPVYNSSTERLCYLTLFKKSPPSESKPTATPISESKTSAAPTFS